MSNTTTLRAQLKRANERLAHIRATGRDNTSHRLHLV